VKAWGLVVAAGAGTRLAVDDADGVPKAMRPLGGVEMFARSLAAFDGARGIEGSVLVVPPLWMEFTLERVLGRFQRPIEMVQGGETRQRSVHAGLERLGADVEAVVVHDAARPFVTPGLIERALDGLGRADAAICAIRVNDTVKRVEGDRVVETLDRSTLIRVQTPQAFRLRILREAHADAMRSGVEATDDAGLIERVGGTVAVVPGDETNMKVTTGQDLEIAEALLARAGSPS
jgi:2-C-methyl-D-erythritol 4-phosphate cytidylyltransferase